MCCVSVWHYDDDLLLILHSSNKNKKMRGVEIMQRSKYDKANHQSILLGQNALIYFYVTMLTNGKHELYWRYTL